MLRDRAFLLKFCAGIAVAGAVLAAQQQLPSEPPRQFGTSITGAFEGWFDDRRRDAHSSWSATSIAI